MGNTDSKHQDREVKQLTGGPAGGVNRKPTNTHRISYAARFEAVDDFNRN